MEPPLGVIGACLPCLGPLFQGISPESVIRSIRSQISLPSLRSPKGSPKRSLTTTSRSGPSSSSHERFAHSVDTAEGPSTFGNEITSVELQERNQLEKTWDGKRNVIHVNQDLHQRTEDMV